MKFRHMVGGGERTRLARDPEVVRIVNQTRGTVVAEGAKVARTLVERGRGLMFSAPLPSGRGLVIDPCSSIHMFFMRFPLDVLYVDREHRVVRAQRAIKPWRIGPLYTRGAEYVIELPVGSIDSSNTTTGDQLGLSPIDGDARIGNESHDATGTTS